MQSYFDKIKEHLAEAKYNNVVYLKMGDTQPKITETMCLFSTVNNCGLEMNELLLNQLDVGCVSLIMTLDAYSNKIDPVYISLRDEKRVASWCTNVVIQIYYHKTKETGQDVILE